MDDLFADLFKRANDELFRLRRCEEELKEIKKDFDLRAGALSAKEYPQSTRSTGEIFQEIKDSRGLHNLGHRGSMCIEPGVWRKWVANTSRPSLRSLCYLAQKLKLTDAEIADIVRSANFDWNL